MTARDALTFAKKEFLGERPIDMGVLAAKLGVNRVTLYRWVGTRDQLLTEIIWQLTQKTFQRAELETRLTGGARVAHVTSVFINSVISNAGMRYWLKREGDAAMRLLTSRDGEYQPRLVGLIKKLLEEQMKLNILSLPIPAHEMAFFITRLAESYVYRRFITGEVSDGSSSHRLLQHLLR